jgi:esterase/lipase
LQAARSAAEAQSVITNLAPFMLEPGNACAVDETGKYQRGIVLIHGLFDSPYSMRPLGEYLQSQCFYVLGLLLPDHGTRPGDFLDARWEDWAAATHFATTQLAARAHTVFLSGHSAGGTLALLEAARNPEVDALVLFAPALAITPAAKYAKYVALVGKLFPAAAWYEVQADAAVYRYESITFRSAAETYALIAATKAALAEQQRQFPVFTVATMQDNTVDTQAILDYMATNADPRSRTLLYSQFPWPPADRMEVATTYAPEQDVLSVSHLGLMTPPSHPHYGRDGVYRNCGHYGAASNPRFVRCKAGERDFYGETTGANLAQGVLERIAFNPFYEAMLDRLAHFATGID